MEEEIEQRMSSKKALYTEDMHWSTQVIEQCLLATDKRLLESVMYGNLALDSQNDRKLASRLEALMTQSRNQPGIYMQQLVSNNGLSPSAAELLKMAEFMENYVKGCRQAGT
jgi:hypothetical protein